jgi:hypothetical protein
MDTSLDTFITLYRFTSGRVLFAMGQVVDAAKSFDAGLGEIVEHAGSTIKQAKKTRATEGKYAQAQKTPKGNPKVGKLDVELDRSLVAFRNAAQAVIDNGPEDESDDGPQRAHSLLDAVFPRGVTAITQATHVDELSLVEGLLATIKQDHADTVAELGLDRYVKRVAKLAPQFKAALKEKPPVDVDSSQVRAARDRMQEMLLEVVAMIAGRFPRRTDEDIAARRALLGPILQQNAAVGQYIRTRRAVEDVDPNTGAPQPSALPDPVADAAAPENTSPSDDA